VPKIILLVEDNADDEELTRMALEQSNIANDLMVARDGVEALDYLYGTGPYAGGPMPDLPTLVLLDLKLPRVDGFEVLQRIRKEERTRRIPVVVMTSSKEEQDILDSYGLGANSYIRKPVEFDRFFDATKQLGLYWLVLNETLQQPSG
jgi:two-component system response regulator